jgi:hypothetical protein
MKEHRSASQISFGFLPEQTVDLRGKVWKVKEWTDARPRSVQVESLRQELEHQVGPWAAKGKDGKYFEQLKAGYAVRLLSLNRESGVRVERFPQSWICKSCNRLYQNSEPVVCQCGQKRFGQLPFVGYHDECGTVRTPYIKPCPKHGELKCVLPGTARAEEIRFSCPVCNRELQKGFGIRACDCGKGRMIFNVHRAASVYTPRTLVMINPPSNEKVQRIRDAGGPSQALSWVLSGLTAATFDELELTEDSFRATLRRQGIKSPLLDQMIEMGRQSGAFSLTGSPIDLQSEKLIAAETGAVNIALALADSRVRISDLEQGTSPTSELGNKYRVEYPRSLSKVGLESVEFVDSFPVLTGCYGYTRGDQEPGASRLVPFRDARGEYVVYGDIIKTEALLVRLEAESVAKWMKESGSDLEPWVDDESARLSILKSSVIPSPAETVLHENPGSRLLTLIHSYSHWFIRRLAVHSGVEQNALSEFLVPQHCAFFVYAASRGDFVLGGLQAVFESDLDTFLKDLVQSDLRCPLDPGCQRAGGACMGCLHLGEPSCRYYNRYLDRESLMRGKGYLSLTGKPASRKSLEL